MTRYDVEVMDDEDDDYQPRRGSKRSLRRAPRGVSLTDVVERIGAIVGEVLIIVVGGFARISIWITQPPGSMVPLGVIIIALIWLNALGYRSGIRTLIDWELIPAMPSMFVNLLAIASSTGINTIQAMALRDNVERKKLEYDRLNTPDTNLPPKPKNKIDVVKHFHRQYKQAGMSRVRQKGLSIFLTYVVDYGTALYQFLGWGLSNLVFFPVAVLLILLSVHGSENMINLFLDALEDAKAQRKRQAKVEVLD